MKNKYLAITLLFAVGLIMALLLVLGGATTAVVADEPQAGDITVCLGGGCDHSTIQAGVDAALDGDVIKVAGGTYTGVELRPRADFTTTGVVTQVVYISKEVSIQGGYTTTNWMTPNAEAYPTTVDAGGQGRGVYITGDISPTIEGLRITGGDANVLPNTEWGSNHGGGIFVYSATAVIAGNWVFGNNATFGGGIAVLLSDKVTITSNRFTSNTVGVIGGGMVIDSVGGGEVSDNVIENNEAYFGGGIHVFQSDIAVVDNWFQANKAGGLGGAVSLIRNRTTLSGNLISANMGEGGAGGVWVSGGFPTFVNNAIIDNTGPDGSGILFEGASGSLVHTTLARNSGGPGILVVGEPYTIAMTNTIVSSHTVGIDVQGNSTATLAGVLWHMNDTDHTGNVTATDVYTGDPQFAADGYHIMLGSAAEERGVDTWVTVDIDGSGRPDPLGTKPDLGADEIGPRRVYLPVVLRNQ